jgi:hypothetical protein
MLWRTNQRQRRLRTLNLNHHLNHHITTAERVGLALSHWRRR